MSVNFNSAKLNYYMNAKNGPRNTPFNELPNLARTRKKTSYPPPVNLDKRNKL